MLKIKIQTKDGATTAVLPNITSNKEAKYFVELLKVLKAKRRAFEVEFIQA